eukprot:3892613-Rhodomonas_salina.2
MVLSGYLVAVLPGFVTFELSSCCRVVVVSSCRVAALPFLAVLLPLHLSAVAVWQFGIVFFGYAVVGTLLFGHQVERHPTCFKMLSDVWS